MPFYTCGPNEVMIVSGCCQRRPQYVCGGRVYVLPCVQQIQRLSLNVMTLIIESSHIYTKLGVPVSVTGVAQVSATWEGQGKNKSISGTMGLSIAVDLKDCTIERMKRVVRQ
ncbi:hypothetical protein RRG08_049032 [Elysia crispata]|uniref:Uncharacterized protein n=1 Tax=Elysia crispata TaxID=231223 RepID=A0AAE1DKV8_9GAST|nr:hypothetical protein RRG08_049032 [Elysia crispata]